MSSTQRIAPCGDCGGELSWRMSGPFGGGHHQAYCPKCDEGKPTDDRALWAMRVLDKWAEKNSGLSFQTDTDPDDHDTEAPWICGVHGIAKYRDLAKRGKTADIARVAAAEALVSSDATLG